MSKPSRFPARAGLVLFGLSAFLPAPGAMAAPAPALTATPTAAGGAKPASPPSPDVPAVMPMPSAPAPDPLLTPSAPVAHPDRMLIEAVARAGNRLVAGGIDGLLVLSDDNGATWRQIQLPVSTTLTAIRFTDEHAGWAIGHYGAVLRTLDAGEHWYLVCDLARAAQTLLDAARGANTSDSARSAAMQAAQGLLKDSPARPFLLIQTSGADTIRLVGAGGLAIESLDGGRSWLAWSAALGDPDGLQLNGLADRDGYLTVAGAHGTLLGGRAEDGLRTLRSPYDGSFFGALDGGRYGVVLYGQQGHIFASSDPGPDLAAGREPSWRRIEDPSPTALTAGLLRGDGSVMLGDASGATWRVEGKPDDLRVRPAGSPATFPILSMAEASDRSLILAGAGGLIRIAPGTIPPSP